MSRLLSSPPGSGNRLFFRPVPRYGSRMKNIAPRYRPGMQWHELERIADPARRWRFIEWLIRYWQRKTFA